MVTLLKNNIVSLVSIVLLIGLLVFAFINMSSDAVAKEMDRIIGGAGQLQTLMRQPQNAATIEAEKRRVELFNKEIERGMATVRQINEHKVLMDGVFPKPESQTRRFEFKAAYTAELAKLPAVVGGGDLPGPAEIQEAETEIDELKALEREKAAGGPEAAAPISERPTPGSPATPGRPGGQGESNEPKYNAKLRAQVNKARNIQCYIGIDNRRSFHVSPIVRQNTPPEPDAMWFAQVGLWVQEDLYRAIAKVNSAAAATLTAGAEPSVQNLPVKRIDRIEILGYVTDKTVIPFPRDSAESPGAAASGGPLAALSGTGTGQKTFTGRVSDNDFDVLRFELTAVVDQRDILQVIHEITRTNLYQCIDCDYQLVDPKERDEGYFYGPEPCVRARFVFEGYFTREIYDPLMPESVRKLFTAGN